MSEVLTDFRVEFEQIMSREFGQGCKVAVAEERTAATVWQHHRICAPDHAGAVFRRCLRDTSVLPRWHQEDRGQRNAVRGVHVPAAAGAYKGIAVWSGRTHWLDVVVPVAVAAGTALLAKHHVSADTLTRWAVVKSGYADARNGRRCIVRPDTVASVMGVSQATVMRCQRAARAMGLEVVVMQGRMLTLDERLKAGRWGSRQRGLSNEVALTVPGHIREEVARRTRRMSASVDHDTPSRGVWTSSKSNLEYINRHGLRPTRMDGAPRQPLLARRRWMEACRVASDVSTALPWLSGEGRRRLAPPLMRFLAAETPWTAREIVHAVETSMALRGGVPELIHTRPAVLFAAVLRRLDPVLDHPTMGGSFAQKSAPCGGSACDGFGWINTTDRSGHEIASPCPDCPPAVRGIQATDQSGTHDVREWGQRERRGEGLPPF